MLSEYSPSDIAWIGALQVFLLYLGGALSGPLSDRYGVKVSYSKTEDRFVQNVDRALCIKAVLIPSSITMVFSVMMNSLCKKYYQFILSQGVLGGLSTGFIFTPSLSVIGQYFLQRRAAAM